MCECEECLALRAAEDGSDDTVAAFDHDGSTYEIGRASCRERVCNDV